MAYTGINEWKNYWTKIDLGHGKVSLDGISTHADKLPLKDSLVMESNSYALCGDTGDVYFYSKELDQWILQ